jgi:error-prone DNA polymerase
MPSAASGAAAGLILLTGGREGTLARLVLAGRSADAEAVAARYRRVFGHDHVFVEVQHHRRPDSVWLLDRLAAVAAAAELRLVATNGVRHATRGELAS